LKDLQDLINEYGRERANYDRLAAHVAHICRALLANTDLRIHAITSRAKTEASFRAKIIRPEFNITRIEDVTDLAGVRIITLFEDEVDSIAQLVTHEFDVDDRKSVDKRMKLDPDRFGYISLHKVVVLREKHLQDSGHDDFRNRRAELQIRSILQHSWAEIEHDLGYKTEFAVPPAIRRRFSRMAGLLEVADTEFTAIRHFLKQYEQRIEGKLARAEEDISVNQISLTRFAQISSLVGQLDAEVAKLGGAGLTFESTYIASRVPELMFVGIETISTLEKQMQRYSRQVVSIATRFLARERYIELPRGICLLYLCYAVLASEHSQEDILRFSNLFKIGRRSDRKEFARNLHALGEQWRGKLP
jgi:putative GTP pyrophosphokinase